MRRLVSLLLSFGLLAADTRAARADDVAAVELFEKRIRPVLVERCYSCHSDQVKQPKGGLRLDTHAGLKQGGESGPIVVPGKPDESALIKALRYETVEMPPQQPLTAVQIADFARWVELGAIDPRRDDPAAKQKSADWESVFQQRRTWWSAQPVAAPNVPEVKNTAWCRTSIDRFVLARLEAQGLTPAPEADATTLARRLSFALTGLPPVATTATTNAIVDQLLASSHFGERWARHWMDVIHFADTHGYEWDIPCKGSATYRDYLIRAFNADVPFRQLIVEQLAGDLLEQPRIDRATNTNESLIGLVALRLGERRHGDSAEFEGIHQEAIDNTIDTATKAFQATTVACARCHDHKLDAVAQADYYAMAGVLMSSRWSCRKIDAVDPNLATIEQLKQLKIRLRTALAPMWLEELDRAAADLAALVTPTSTTEQTSEDPVAARLADVKKSLASEKLDLSSVLYPWRALMTGLAKGEKPADIWQPLGKQYQTQHDDRSQKNREQLTLVADFSRGTLPAGWRVEGFGIEHGLVGDGELIVATNGAKAVERLLPAGLYTHVYSPRLGGLLQSPLFGAESPWWSLEVVAGDLAGRHVVVDNALFPEARFKFLAHAAPTWHTIATLPEEVARGRRVFVEVNTKAYNNYYPPRVGLYKRFSDEERDGPKSWFGVTRVYAHRDQATAPRDELTRFLPLFGGDAPTSLDEIATRFRRWSRAALERWLADQATADDVAIINGLLESGLLTNRNDAPQVADLAAEYRRLEAQLVAERTVGGVADLAEGRDEPIAIRGSYTERGAVVPRGYIRLLTGEQRSSGHVDSGRLELAQTIASDGNPLTARVYVNRVWTWLFGRGIVPTVDDFGHLGAQPSDLQLLDHLASQFMAHDWSTKWLVREIVTSATWRQSGAVDRAAMAKDPDNRLWHHFPLRRLEAEAIRDAMLAVSGRLDERLYGAAVDPYRASEDGEKRLFSGPVDGDGRRSLYTKMTLMEPPKFLAIFNQPLPKLTVGQRDVTNVPDQALALLNDPLVVGQAKFWAERVVKDGAPDATARVDAMFARALARRPNDDERQRLLAFVDRVAELRSVPADGVMTSTVVWQDVAHALFNLKEFIYVR